MVDVNVEITVEDSPIENALDLYYDHLYTLLTPQAHQRLALNSTLVTFDILPEAPMYTEYVFRAFADRTVTLSPTEVGPVALGVANINDRFSWTYTELLRQAVFAMDLELPQESIDKIDLLEREINATRKELQTFFQEMFTKWTSHAKENGIKEDEPTYLDKQTSYFNLNHFAEQLTYYKERIGGGLQKIYILRDAQYPDAEAKHIASLLRFATMDQYLMARPKDPQLEEINKYDAIKLGQAYIYNNLNYFEAAVEVRPSGYLPKFLNNIGKRDVTITKGATATHQHDVAWSASGSARKWLFFKASVSAAYESHLRETVEATNELKIGFENLAEYWVNRGPWFASNVFGYKRIKKVLADNPKMAGILAFAISSVVIGRGLALTMKFSKASTFSEWSKFTVSASGSFSAFGINIPMSSGTFSDYKLDTNTASDGKGVTFFDDPNHARLLGFRVDKLFDGAEEFALAASPYLEDLASPSIAPAGIGGMNIVPTFSPTQLHDKLIESGRKKLLASSGTDGTG